MTSNVVHATKNNTASLEDTTPVPLSKADKKTRNQSKRILGKMGTSKSKAKKKSRMIKKAVDPTSVSVHKMASKKIEGWKIKVDDKSCGSIKFTPVTDDDVLDDHVSLYFTLPKPQRGRHIGRVALIKSMEISSYTFFVAHLRKSNTASKKALEASGFTVFDYPDDNQLCMTYRKT